MKDIATSCNCADFTRYGNCEHTRPGFTTEKMLRAVVEERDKERLLPCLHDAPEYVTAEYFKERYPHTDMVSELRRRVHYCRLCGEDVTGHHLMVIGGPK